MLKPGMLFLTIRITVKFTYTQLMMCNMGGGKKRIQKYILHFLTTIK